MSAIHNQRPHLKAAPDVVCDIGGYDFVSYSQLTTQLFLIYIVVCDIGGYDFVSYSQPISIDEPTDLVVCDIGGYDFVSYSQQELW